MKPLTHEGVLAKERRLTLALLKRNQAEEDARIRADAAADRFAARHPAFAAEVESKLSAMAAEQMAGIPSWKVHQRGLVLRAARDAYNSTMADAKAALAEKARGPGNRAFRRSAKVRGSDAWLEARKAAGGAP